MSERENEGNNPSQKPGYEQQGNRNVTNSDRDRQPTNAANQQRNENPNMGSQREGQQQNDQSRSNDPTGMKNTDKVIPEVPQREEERKRETPKANQGNQNDTDQNTPQL